MSERQGAEPTRVAPYPAHPTRARPEDQHEVPAAAPPLAASPLQRNAVFGVVALMLLMGSADQTAVAAVLPSMQADLAAPLLWTGWTVTIYMLGQVLALPLAGRMSDQFGRRRVFLVAVATFGLASLTSATAPTIHVLILCRLAQGLAAGAFLPSATGIVSDTFGPGRDRAIAAFTTIFPIGAIVGPTLGAAINAAAGWRAIFLINLPIGLVALVAGWLLLPRSGGGRTEKLDFAGAGLLVGLMIGLMLAVSVGGSGPFDAATIAIVVGALALAVGAFVLLRRHLRRTENPLVPLQLLRGETFRRLNAGNFLFGVAALGQASLVPWYAVTRYGMSPLVAGGLLAFRAIGMIVASMVSVAVIRRFGFRPLMLIGTALVMIGLVVLAAPAPAVAGPEVWIALSTTATGLGMGLAAPASSNAGLHLAPEHVSSVSGLRGMFRQAGGIAGITVLTAFTSSSADPATTQAIGYLVLAAILLATTPMVVRLPNKTGRW